MVLSIHLYLRKRKHIARNGIACFSLNGEVFEVKCSIRNRSHVLDLYCIGDIISCNVLSVVTASEVSFGFDDLILLW